MTETQRLRAALEEIIDPLAALQKRAKADGRQLSGQAYSICNDVEYLKGIARAAVGRRAPDRRGQMADKSELGAWIPAVGTVDHVLFDQLVLGRVERFYEDGPCYAWIGDRRLGAFETDTAAREVVMDHAFAAAIDRHLAKSRRS